MRMEFLLPKLLLLICCWPVTSAMDKKEFHELLYRKDLAKGVIEKVHYDINPELAENLRLLVRMDRHTLKTILENQAALYETLLVSLIFEAHNASTQAGYCATQEQRAHHKTLVDRKTKIESVIDQSLDTMYGKWGELETQDDLEAYFVKYWNDRDALYNYVSQRNSDRDCKDGKAMDQKCTAVESLEASFGKAFMAMAQCKLKLS